jgi:hypothetical protein
MLLNCNDSLVVFPFLTLENPQHKSCFVVVAFWNLNIILFAKITESIQLGLFFIPEFNIHENEPLIYSTSWNGDEFFFNT